MIVRRELAYDFLLFCQRNPKPCPLLDVTDPGSFEPRHAAPGADIRTDFPRYRIYRNGELDQEVQDITPFWEDDMVAFLIGCSFSFEAALLANGVPVRHIEDGHNVLMYRTNIASPARRRPERADGGEHAADACEQGGARRAGHIAISLRAWRPRACRRPATAGHCDRQTGFR